MLFGKVYILSITNYDISNTFMIGNSCSIKPPSWKLLIRGVLHCLKNIKYDVIK